MSAIERPSAVSTSARRYRMLESIRERARLLLQYVETVMEGLQMVSNTLAVKKVPLLRIVIEWTFVHACTDP
jgi:hypothetical protein